MWKLALCKLPLSWRYCLCHSCELLTTARPTHSCISVVGSSPYKPCKKTQMNRYNNAMSASGFDKWKRLYKGAFCKNIWGQNINRVITNCCSVTLSVTSRQHSKIVHSGRQILRQTVTMILVMMSLMVDFEVVFFQHRNVMWTHKHTSFPFTPVKDKEVVHFAWKIRHSVSTFLLWDNIFHRQQLALFN